MLYLNRRPKTLVDTRIAGQVASSLGIKNAVVQQSSYSYTNDVFRLSHDGSVYYLKFFTDQWMDPNAGMQEIKGYELLRAIGIRTPTVLHYEKSNHGRNYALLSALQGRPLLKNMESLRDPSIINDSITTLDKFASIQGPLGFICHADKVHPTYADEYEFLNDITEYGIKKLSDLGHSVHDLTELIGEWRNVINQPQHSFSHNDFTPKHVFVDDEGISGVIDLEWANYSNPQSDRALWIVSLAEYHAPIHALETAMCAFKEKDDNKSLHFHVARWLILCAAWPHKNVDNTYSRTCIDKARKILRKHSVVIEDLLWTVDSGALEAESSAI